MSFGPNPPVPNENGVPVNPEQTNYPVAPPNPPYPPYPEQPAYPAYSGSPVSSPAPGAPYGYGAPVPPQGPGYGYGVPPVQPAQTDGISIAALVTGVLGTGPVAIILGIVGISRTKNGERNGRGMAIAGLVLGILVTLSYIALIAIGFWVTSNGLDPYDPGNYSVGTDAELEVLSVECIAGDMAACDELYDQSEVGSKFEETGSTCGNRSVDDRYCVSQNLPGTY